MSKERRTQLLTTTTETTGAMPEDVNMAVSSARTHEPKGSGAKISMRIHLTKKMRSKELTKTLTTGLRLEAHQPNTLLHRSPMQTSTPLGPRKPEEGAAPGRQPRHSPSTNRQPCPTCGGMATDRTGNTPTHSTAHQLRGGSDMKDIGTNPMAGRHPPPGTHRWGQGKATTMNPAPPTRSNPPIRW